MRISVSSKVVYARRLVAFLLIIGALFAQPLLQLNLPAVFAADPAVDNIQGWQQYSASGGAAELVVDSGAGVTGNGALQLSTPADASYVQYYRDAISPVSVAGLNLSYASKRVSGAPHAAPAYVLGIDLNGDGNATDEAYAWYEPVYNSSSATNYDSWNTWTIDTHSIFHFNGSISKVNNREYNTLEALLETYQNAKIIDFTINQGRGNGGWITLVNTVTTPETTYSFEPRIVDTQAPVVSNISIAQKVNNSIGQTITVTFDVNDTTGVDLTKSRLLFSDGPNKPNQLRESSKYAFTPVSDNSYQVTLDTRSFVKQNYTGTYNLAFNLYDTLGNHASAKPPTFRGMLVDNSGPSSTLISPASGTIVHGTQRLSFDVSDDTGVKSGYIKLNGPTSKQFALLQSTGNQWYADVDTTLLTDGSYTIDARLVDSFGTPRYGANKGAITIDNNAPDVSSIVLNGIAVDSSDTRSANCSPVTKFHLVSKSIDLSALINDETTNVASASYKIRKVTAGGCTQTAIYSSGNVGMRDDGSGRWVINTAAFDSSSLNGQYTVMLSVKDSAGNLTTKYIDVEIDNTLPVVTITQPTKTTVYNAGNITIVGVVDDTTVSTVKVEFNSVTKEVALDTTTGRWTATFENVPAGQYTLTATAQDSAGNTGNVVMVGVPVIATTIDVILPVDPAKPSNTNKEKDQDKPTIVRTQTPAQQLTPLAFGLPQAATQAQNAAGTDQAKDADTAVLGDETKNPESDQPDTAKTLASEDKKVVSGAWGMFGLAWYWWLLILAGLGSTVYAVRRS